MLLKRLALLATCSVLVPFTFAQDSIRPASGLPGDALDPYNTAQQQATFVVDLAAFTTSWGTTFGVAPIAKSSHSDPAFYTSLINAQSASASLRTDVPYPFNAYAEWNTAGEGVNALENNAPSSVANPVGLSNQFAFAMNEDSGEYDGMITAVANFDSADPSRLYVARIVSAINGPNAFLSDAAFGAGAVDAHGNTYFRADDFGLTGANQITGNNLFRVNAFARTANAVNLIGSGGASDTGDWLVALSGTTFNTPGCIPEDLAGRPVYIGSNFNSQYAYESAPNTISTTTGHLGAYPDHRGNVSFSKTDAFSGSGCLGTAALLGKDLANALTDRMLLWGVDANGAICGGQLDLPWPNSVTDNSDSFAWPPFGTADQPVHHNSQVAFSGGNGQIAIGEDAGGNILVATVVSTDNANYGNENPENAILVARYDPSNPGGTLQWTTAAYNTPTAGKAILDGPGGTQIGTLTELNKVTGGTPVGPSMSCPTIDAAGNIWFLSAAELDLGGGQSDFDNVLVRAVYNPANFSFELDLVLELGQRFMGLNSNTEYMLTFLSIADSNSVSSGTMFSGNMLGCPCNDIDPTGLTQTDPRNMGGLVINAELTYDVNGDGMFDGGTMSADQEYNVLLYVGATDCDTPSLPVTKYCTAKASFAGCLASLTTSNPAVGPISGANDYSVIMNAAQTLRPGIFFTSNTGMATIPFQGGTLCFFPPLRRSPIQFTGGAAQFLCTGGYTLVINDGVLIPLGFDAGPGGTSFIQAWYRSPSLPDGFGTALSDALQINWQ